MLEQLFIGKCIEVKVGGNWLWRMKPDQLSLELSMKYYRLNRQTERG